MSDNDVAHPGIVSRDEWLRARKKLLAREKKPQKPTYGWDAKPSPVLRPT